MEDVCAITRQDLTQQIVATPAGAQAETAQHKPGSATRSSADQAANANGPDAKPHTTGSKPTMIAPDTPLTVADTCALSITDKPTPTLDPKEKTP
jgi:hypothetical protein